VLLVGAATGIFSFSLNCA